MHIKTLISAIAVLLIFSSCHSKLEAKFEITNMTNDFIDSIYILPDNTKNHFVQLKPHGKQMYNTDMTGMPKIDGSYILFYKYRNKAQGTNFGYYTNGFPLESITRIYIHTDTVIINYEFGNNY